MQICHNNSENPCFIGIDLGTTGVRAIAYDLIGTQLHIADEFYPLHTLYPKWAEQDPIIIFNAMKTVLKKVAGFLSHIKKTPIGLSLSTAMHSFSPANSNKELINDLMIWADSRSADIVNEFKKDQTLTQSFYQKTCCPAHSCYPFFKILWFQQNYPSLPIAYIYSLKDFIFEKLTGKWCIDQSSACSSGLYNARELNWDQEVLNFANLHENQLPEVVPTTFHAPLQKTLALELGLPEGLSVVIGATDGVLANLGVGAIKQGDLSLTIGTSGAVRMLTKTPKIDIERRTWCYNLAENLWVVGGAINNGGIIMRWMRDNICHYSPNHLENIDIDAYDLMTLKASKIKAGSEGLLALPFFTGERAPYWNSELKGMFFGLSLNHSRSHMIRAIMEGICFSLKCVFNALKEFEEVKQIRISGSFTKSPLWIQTLSDIFEENIILPQNSEGAAYGAAILGFMAHGYINDLQEISSFIKDQKTYHPQEEHFQVYRELFRIYDNLYKKLEPDFLEISTFQNKFNLQ